MLNRFIFNLLVFLVILKNGAFSKFILKNVETFEIDNNELGFHGMSRNASERINLSVPGTKWCGPGNTADGYDDLGPHEDVDKCCREHDHCDNIAAGESKYGLKNDDYFTRYLNKLLKHVFTGF